MVHELSFYTNPSSLWDEDYILQEVLPPSCRPQFPYPKRSETDKLFFIMEGEELETYNGSLFSIVRGTLHVGNSNHVKVVYKYAFGSDYFEEIERLKTEARYYDENMRSLQGKGVPHFFGFYYGHGETYTVHCILLEDAGESVEWEDFICGQNQELM